MFAFVQLQCVMLINSATFLILLHFILKYQSSHMFNAMLVHFTNMFKIVTNETIQNKTTFMVFFLTQLLCKGGKYSTF